MDPLTDDDYPTLSERMWANIEDGSPDCANPSEHVWFGSFGVATCAVCLMTTEELREQALSE